MAEFTASRSTSFSDLSDIYYTLLPGNATYAGNASGFTAILNGVRITVTGTGFTYDADSAPETGTIHLLTVETWYLVQYNHNFTFSGLNLSYEELVSHLVTWGSLNLYKPFLYTDPATDFTITGSKFADELWGENGNDIVYGGGGDDRLTGMEGNDRVFGGEGNDTVLGYDGDDLLDGGAGNDGMEGGKGNDVYIVDSAGDTVIEKPNEGIDTVQASVSFALSDNVENLVLTGAANLAGKGNALANAITGNAGGNVLAGLGGDDSLKGGAGNDTLDGGTGADMMAGGAGDDTYFVDNAGDTVIESVGQGIDTVISSIAFVLGANVEHLTLVGAADSVAKASAAGLNGTGNGLANTMTGSAGANRLDGGAGDDVLAGAGGRDVLIGGKGNDRLSGGEGRDKLVGGKGKDAFLFDVAPGKSGMDTIKGFQAGKDKILLDDAVFGALGLGKLKKAAFFAGKAAHDGSDRVVYDKGTGKLFFDADGKGGEKALVFAKLGNGLDLSHSDFLVV